MPEKMMKGEIVMSDLFLDCLEKSDSDCSASQGDTTSRVSDEQSWEAAHWSCMSH